MPVWLVPIIGWISHNVARFIGVVAIGAILIGGPMVLYHHITEKAYENGYKVGYSKAISDHPSVVQGDYYANGKEPFFIFIKLGKFRLFAI